VSVERAHRIIRDRKDRKARVARHYEKLEMLRAMLEEHEQLSEPDDDEIRKLKQRIRTLEQQIRYIGD